MTESEHTCSCCKHVKVQSGREFLCYLNPPVLRQPATHTQTGSWVYPPVHDDSTCSHWASSAEELPQCVMEVHKLGPHRPCQMSGSFEGLSLDDLTALVKSITYESCQLHGIPATLKRFREQLDLLEQMSGGCNG